MAARGLDRAARSAQLVEVALTRQLGTRLRLENSFRDRLGYLISTGRDSRQAAAAAERALACVRLQIEQIEPVPEPALLVDT